MPDHALTDVLTLKSQTVPGIMESWNQNCVWAVLGAAARLMHCDLRRSQPGLIVEL